MERKCDDVWLFTSLGPGVGKGSLGFLRLLSGLSLVPNQELVYMKCINSPRSQKHRIAYKEPTAPSEMQCMWM